MQQIPDLGKLVQEHHLDNIVLTGSKIVDIHFTYFERSPFQSPRYFTTLHYDHDPTAGALDWGNLWGHNGRMRWEDFKQGSLVSRGLRYGLAHGLHLFESFFREDRSDYEMRFENVPSTNFRQIWFSAEILKSEPKKPLDPNLKQIDDYIQSVPDDVTKGMNKREIAYTEGSKKRRAAYTAREHLRRDFCVSLTRDPIEGTPNSPKQSYILRISSNYHSGSEVEAITQRITSILMK